MRALVLTAAAIAGGVLAPAALTAGAGAAPVATTPAAAAPAVAAKVAAQLTVASPVAGVPFGVRITGTGGSPASGATADAAPAAAVAIVDGSVACPLSYAEVVGSTYANAWHWAAGDPAGASFDRQAVLTVDQPGTYRACSYAGLEGSVQIDADSTATRVRSSLDVRVARPAVSVRVDLSPGLYAAGGATLHETLAANAPERVEVQLNGFSDACRPTPAANAQFDRFLPGPDPQPVYGQAAADLPVTLPAFTGAFHLCTYAYRAAMPADPDLVLDSSTTHAPYVVGLQPPPTNLGPTIYGDGSFGTKQVSCTLSSATIRRGKSMRVHCPGVTGKLAVRLLQKANKPRERAMTVVLTKGGWGAISTQRLAKGLWRASIKWSGYLALQTRFAVR